MEGEKREGTWREEGDHAYRCTVTTRVTPVLRLAAMRAILMIH